MNIEIEILLMEISVRGNKTKPLDLKTHYKSFYTHTQRPCYKHELKDDNHSCPQCKSRYKRLKVFLIGLFCFVVWKSIVPAHSWFMQELDGLVWAFVVCFFSFIGLEASAFALLRATELWNNPNWFIFRWCNPNILFGLDIENVSVPSILASSGLTANSLSMCFGPDGAGRVNFGDKGSSDQGETPHQS